MMRVTALGAAAIVLYAANVPAQSTTIAPATTRDFAWLAGTWEGHMVGRAGAVDITFTKPSAGTIAGVMRLVDNDKVLVIELLSIVDAASGTEMRFRHFSPSLDAYEPQFKQSMRLSAHSAERDVFENTTPYDKALTSTQPRITQFIRHGPDEFVGRSDIIDDSGKPAVMEATYRRK